MPSPIDIDSFATGLEPGPDGIWYARHRREVSYPEGAHRACRLLEENSFWFEHRNACILAVARRFPPAGPLFDVGGGNGFVSLGLQTAGIDAVVVEPGREGVLAARQRGLTSVICSTLEDAGFRPGALPAVGLFDVLEHLEDDEAFLECLRRLLVPRGRLYLTTPAYGFLWSEDDVQAGHKRRYTLGRLVGKLDRAGLRLLFGSYAFALLPPAIFLRRTLPSLIGRSQAADAEHERRLHTAPGRLSGRLLRATLRVELSRLRRGRRMPFGGSCLLVAEADGRSAAG